MGPNTNVIATGVGGAIATIVAWLTQVVGAPMPPTVAAAVATIAAVVIGWVRPPR